jgi:predicted nuclease of predicted toxin-antitoxin system
VKFLLDAQMPPALARWLQEQGHEAQAVREVGLRDAEDGAIWMHAKQSGTIIVTKDEDFAVRAQRDPSGPVVVWLRVGNCSNAALRAWLDRACPESRSL